MLPSRHYHGSTSLSTIQLPRRALYILLALMIIVFLLQGMMYGRSLEKLNDEASMREIVISNLRQQSPEASAKENLNTIAHLQKSIGAMQEKLGLAEEANKAHHEEHHENEVVLKNKIDSLKELVKSYEEVLAGQQGMGGSNELAGSNQLAGYSGGQISSGQISSGQNLQFVHIPKTAGSVIAYASDRNAWSFGHQPLNRARSQQSFTWEPCADRDHQTDVAGQCSFYHVPPEWFDPPMGPYEGKTLFTILRDPYQKLISEFNWICWAARGVATQKFDAVQRILDIDGKSYLTVPPLKHAQDNENIRRCQQDREIMNEFFRKAVSTQTERRSSYEMMTDCHLIPQHIYTQSIDHVFCDMPAMKAFLAQGGYDIEAKSKLKDSTLHKYDVEKLLDRDVIDLINDVYSEDFDLCDDFQMI